MTRWRTLALGLCGALAAAASLWPFDFRLDCRLCRNGAAALPEAPGFAFRSPGTVTDPAGPSALYTALAGQTEISIVLVLRSAKRHQTGPARIVSWSATKALRNFTIGQEKDRIVLRLRTPGTGPNGNDPPTQSGALLRPGQDQVVVATYDGAAFRIFIDGVLAGERLLAAGPLAEWDPAYPLLFGNEATGNRPWLGVLHDLAIYDRALTAGEIGDLTAAAQRARSGGGQRGDEQTGRAAPPGHVYHLAAACGIGGAACLIPERYENSGAMDFLSTIVRKPADLAVQAVLWAALTLAAAATGMARPLALAAALAVSAILFEIAQAAVISRTSSLWDLAGSLGGVALACAAISALWRRV